MFRLVSCLLVKDATGQKNRRAMRQPTHARTHCTDHGQAAAADGSRGPLEKGGGEQKLCCDRWNVAMGRRDATAEGGKGAQSRREEAEYMMN